MHNEEIIMKNCDGYGHLHDTSMFVTNFKIAVFASLVHLE